MEVQLDVDASGPHSRQFPLPLKLPAEKRQQLYLEWFREATAGHSALLGEDDDGGWQRYVPADEEQLPPPPPPCSS
eukprot:SAG22_NODE_4392_length_1284_cov_1.705485_2_plen_75_part_01